MRKVRYRIARELETGQLEQCHYLSPSDTYAHFEQELNERWERFCQERAKEQRAMAVADLKEKQSETVAAGPPTSSPEQARQAEAEVDPRYR